MPKGNRPTGLDFERAAQILETAWQRVIADVTAQPQHNYVSDAVFCRAVADSVNHRLVTYRFCLSIQLLGKMTNPAVDSLKLQRGDGSDPTAWDARSLGSKVVCEFNRRQEGILGDSSDPYVSKPMRQPRMFRDDRSKKDVPGWNRLVDILEQVESQNQPAFTEKVFRQVLLEMYRRQRTLTFSYPIPPRISLESTLALAEEFLRERSGGDRALALSGALFDAIGIHFKLFATVNRARINASDEATGQAADLECVSEEGRIVLAVEVKDRTLTLTDVEGTLQKSRHRAIKDILFTAPGVQTDDQSAVSERVSRAFTAGQNLYVFDFFDLARSVLALGGEAIRTTFLRKVGEHLDKWNTQPRHRQAWKKLLEKV
ncbi:MAG: restriction endonuclease, SacI family [Verrucomicrobiota bacterium]